jgi:hypothetical protein
VTIPLAVSKPPIPLMKSVFSVPAEIVAASRQFSGGNQPDLNFFSLNLLPDHDD